jgi:hypothetical protein
MKLPHGANLDVLRWHNVIFCEYRYAAAQMLILANAIAVLCLSECEYTFDLFQIYYRVASSQP